MIRITLPAEERAQFRLALELAWAVISVIVFAVIVAPWVLTPAQAARLTPKCEWKARYGKPCFFCGTTTAFLDLARGEFKQAGRANRGAIPLYSALVLNEAGWLLAMKRRITNNREPAC